MQRIRRRIQDVNYLIVLLVICFALSSWIDIYGVWIELPLLVHTLPEGWRLPSFILIILECSNVVPILYTIINKCCPGNRMRREVIMAYFIMGVGFISLLFLVFLWRHTAWVFGAERSVAFLLLVLFLSMVDTTSCVVYFPFMDRFKEVYMPAYVTGEELSGFITGVLGLIQGAGGDVICHNETRTIANITTGINYTETSLVVTRRQPRFSVSVYFILLALIMVISIISFCLLNFAPFAESEKVIRNSRGMPMEKTNILKGIDPPTSTELAKKELNGSHPDSCVHEEKTYGGNVNKGSRMSSRRLALCFVMYAWNAFAVYGVFSSIQSFSTLPYGPNIYTLAVRLAKVFNPIAAFVAFFVPAMSLAVIGMLVISSTSLVGFHVFLASQSPHPPLQDVLLGSIIVVLTSLLASALFAYSKASIAAVLRREGGHRALYWGGAAIQVGAVSGGILGFLLVNVFTIFKNLPPCGGA